MPISTEELLDGLRRLIDGDVAINPDYVLYWSDEASPSNNDAIEVLRSTVFSDSVDSFAKSYAINSLLRIYNEPSERIDLVRNLLSARNRETIIDAVSSMKSLSIAEQAALSDEVNEALRIPWLETATWTNLLIFKMRIKKYLSNQRQ